MSFKTIIVLNRIKIDYNFIHGHIWECRTQPIFRWQVCCLLASNIQYKFWIGILFTGYFKFWGKNQVLFVGARVWIQKACTVFRSSCFSTYCINKSARGKHVWLQIFTFYRRNCILCSPFPFYVLSSVYIFLCNMIVFFLQLRGYSSFAVKSIFPLASMNSWIHKKWKL